MTQILPKSNLLVWDDFSVPRELDHGTIYQTTPGVVEVSGVNLNLGRIRLQSKLPKELEEPQKSALKTWATIPAKRDDTISELISQVKELSRKRRPESLKKIAKIWAQGERLVALAEARTRILVNQIQPPKVLEESPAWLTEALSDSSDLAKTVEKAISSCLATIESNEEIRARINTAANQSVIASWEFEDHVLQWEFEQVALNWPGLRVRALFYDTKCPSASEARIIFNAFDLIDNFQAAYESSLRKGMS